MTEPPSGTCSLTEQSIGWALHALEPDEELEVQRHLPTCRACREAVRDAEEVLSDLAVCAEPADPPGRPRDDLRTAAAQTSQAAGRDAEPAEQEGTFDGARNPRPTGTVRPPRPERGRLNTPRGRQLVIASVVLVVVLGIGGLVAWTAQSQAERGAQSGQAQSLIDMVAQFDGPGSKHAILTAAEGTSPVAAVLVHDGQIQVLTVGLPPNTTDRETYVLWGIPGAGAPKAIGTFDVVDAETRPRPVGSVSVADAFTTYAISMEPGRTAPAAPSTMVASGQVET
ncbi:anti-sigma factor [Pseudonocardia asaccharolytica]|uniref:Regulator of SigK n=1 Tax=Pseudonocardia asaccharolytica DSM 44247 = NBRC 16224 TaxID=1123024 RepID=A0A511D268_9PSEU|nr:anti-sigma factor [Pseudonocardia asaccharolytica]GEL18879.1 hypothetical protein PA7_27160 [Pseudonocardia asaccharolytica DSM 44247 = NBRC 16224]